jgi:rRNA maturation protein Nop10
MMQLRECKKCNIRWYTTMYKHCPYCGRKLKILPYDGTKLEEGCNG